MSDIVKFPYSASRRVAARRPRRSKNGTPEERAAKLAPEAGPATVIPRRSKNGTPEERAAKASLGTVINVTSRLTSRAEAAQRRAEADAPMTKEEFAAALSQLNTKQLMMVGAPSGGIEAGASNPAQSAGRLTHKGAGPAATGWLRVVLWPDHATFFGAGLRT
jgi:hypothetical protein